MFNREYQLEQLKTINLYDIVIIGGGASGLGVAVDAASRGFKVALFEAFDFAKGTSSRSTKLVHGGVRYLAQGNIKLVKDALKERGLIEKNVNHLFKRQTFLIPNYAYWDKYFYGVGLKVYDWLSQNLSIGKSKIVSAEEASEHIKELKTDGLTGGVTYLDGQFDDARLALNLAQTATEQGAVILNHFQVVDFIKNNNGQIEGVKVLDTETNDNLTVKAKVVVNATGVFSNKILKLAGRKKRSLKVVPSQGIHLVFDRSFLKGDTALMVPKTSDGRVLFAIPWHNKVLVGTTDTPVNKPKFEPLALKEEIDFILSTMAEYFPKAPTKDDVLSVFAGLRPLVAPEGDKSNTKEISRSHEIIHSDSGLLTIVGGKWTTYREMSEDVVNKAITVHQLDNVEVKTETLKIHGSIPKALKNSIPKDLWYYGNDAIALESFVNANPEYNTLLHPNYKFVIGQIYWAIKNEMARTVEDVLARRIRLLFIDAKAAVECSELVADILQSELKKSLDWRNQQVEDFKNLAKGYLIQDYD
ncbi:MAG: glycerol-3-phosphate dehydrogenase/oxidase [Winogradskyella sp.]|uniref:glycerol-3-phosphate dehydrogenase/oxidase n=1 Tax=Winogradskyella sp. TaxID=1883156 RepID=UPI000F3CF61B|nr:glycerol-3-phosphate dehydrogenase/oxidase [Winogradskyella sp.]RNC86707.1 MAG: glycerol-3-phosphate dehydrogenase/oxidase [Winogradskyella sp.]